MRVILNKFGTMLISRPLGKEAYAAFLPHLANIASDESVELDCAGVNVLTPSWADEFLRPMLDTYGDRLVLLSVDGNPAIKATIEFLEETNNVKFKRG